jgi:hypothetical protein
LDDEMMKFDDIKRHGNSMIEPGKVLESDSSLGLSDEEFKHKAGRSAT